MSRRAVCPFFALLTLCALCANPVKVVASEPGKATVRPDAGSYIDAKTDAKHTWEVTSAHTLKWDGSPYLPVGGTFIPASFTSASEESWKEDVASLAVLKSHGVLDLIVWPERSLPDIPVNAFRRLIDYLDQNGFRYGISFGQGLMAPLHGYVVRPSIYRFEDEHLLTALWPVTDTDAAAYFLVDAGQKSKMLRSGMALVRDNEASASFELGSEVVRPVALLIPREAPAPRPDAAMPDLWTQFDAYRDRILTFLAQIKFGPGLRFFIDPITRHLGIDDETQYLIPDSDAFHVEWEYYLAHKYGSVDAIREKWQLVDDFRSIQDLANLIPLWARDRGFPYFYDPTTGKTYTMQATETVRSSWWEDFEDWRAGSLVYLMSAMADLLKHSVANVPVVYTKMPGNQRFLSSSADLSFDGIAEVTYARDPHRIARVTGPGISLLAGLQEQKSRPLWYIASEIQSPASHMAAADSSTNDDASSEAAYPSMQSLALDLTEMRCMGIKGMYLSGLNRSASRSTGGGWISNPTGLDWLHEYEATLTSDGKAASLMPRILFYPQSAPGPAQLGFVPGDSGMIWLPSNAPGQVVDWWPTLYGYTLQHGDEEEKTTLISLMGPEKHKVVFMTAHAARVKAMTPAGIMVPLRLINKNEFEATFSDEPIIFSARKDDMIPMEAATETAEQLAVLSELAKKDKSQSAAYGGAEYEQVQRMLKNKNYGGAYSAARQQIDILTSDGDIAPYVWLEGENAIGTNFTEVAPNPTASAGAYLRLSTPYPPQHLTYAARYHFSVGEEATYQIWIAATPPGPDVSPVSWYMDRQPEQGPIAAGTPVSSLYLSDHFGWFQLGDMHLSRGAHDLSIKVTDRAQSSHLYSFSIDAIMITQMSRPFVPNGTIHPLPIDSKVVKEFMKLRKHGNKQESN